MGNVNLFVTSGFTASFERREVCQFCPGFFALIEGTNWSKTSCPKCGAEYETKTCFGDAFAAMDVAMGRPAKFTGNPYYQNGIMVRVHTPAIFSLQEA